MLSTRSQSSELLVGAAEPPVPFDGRPSSLFAPARTSVPSSSPSVTLPQPLYSTFIGFSTESFASSVPTSTQQELMQQRPLLLPNTSETENALTSMINEAIRFPTPLPTTVSHATNHSYNSSYYDDPHDNPEVVAHDMVKPQVLPLQVQLRDPLIPSSEVKYPAYNVPVARAATETMADVYAELAQLVQRSNHDDPDYYPTTALPPVSPPTLKPDPIVTKDHHEELEATSSNRYFYCAAQRQSSLEPTRWFPAVSTQSSSAEGTPRLAPSITPPPVQDLEVDVDTADGENVGYEEDSLSVPSSPYVPVVAPEAVPLVGSTTTSTTASTLPSSSPTFLSKPSATSSTSPSTPSPRRRSTRITRRTTRRSTTLGGGRSSGTGSSAGTKPSGKRRSNTVRDKPWICDVCGKGFGRKSNLRQHGDVHNPLRRRSFVCPLPSCNDGFSRKNDCHRHIRKCHLRRQVLTSAEYDLIARAHPTLDLTKIEDDRTR